MKRFPEGAETLRPGMFGHHNEDCDMEFRYASIARPNSKKQTYLAYWCNTHNQWAYESPVEVIYVWANGSKDHGYREECKG